jgi:hypothetical protein
VPILNKRDEKISESFATQSNDTTITLLSNRLFFVYDNYCAIEIFIFRGLGEECTNLNTTKQLSLS